MNNFLSYSSTENIPAKAAISELNITTTELEHQRILGAATSPPPPVSLQAISASDYFIAKQFRCRSHQIFHKTFLIFYIYNIIVLFKKPY